MAAPGSDPRVRHLAVLAAVGALAFGSWSWGYAPAKAAMKREVQTLQSRRAQVDLLEATVAGGGGLDAWLEAHQARVAARTGRLSSRDQLPQLLDTLVNGLKSGPARFVNLTQGSLEPVQHDGQPLLVEGAPCLRLPVTVTMEGRYHDVLKTLSRLMDAEFPSLVTLGPIQFARQAPTEPVLSATAQLSVHVLARGPAATD